MSRMLFFEMYKTMVNKVTFVGFRGGDRPNRPPPGSALVTTYHRGYWSATRMCAVAARRRGCHCWKLSDQLFAFANDLVVPVSSEQNALDRLCFTYNQKEMKISTEKTQVLCLYRNASWCGLQASTNTLQRVRNFK